MTALKIPPKKISESTGSPFTLDEAVVVRQRPDILTPEELKEAALQLRKDNRGQQGVDGLLETCYETLKDIANILPSELAAKYAEVAQRGYFSKVSASDLRGPRDVSVTINFSADLSDRVKALSEELAAA